MRLEKFTESQARIIMEQLLLALDFFERSHIIHRDLKLENILIHTTEGKHFDIRIADFGFSIFNNEN